MEETPSVVGASNNESSNKKTRFILVKGDVEGLDILPNAEGTLYRVSKAAAKDVLQWLKGKGYNAVMLKESKGKSAAA